LFSNHSLIALFFLMPQMGFEAHVKSPAANGGAPGQPAGASMAQEATVQVLGMTCNSCVQNIEGVMGDRPGIASIRVTLADEEAVVRYDPALWSPQAIAEAIDDVCVTFSSDLNELSCGSEACDEIYLPRCEVVLMG
jgi:Cu+-exporting ATPase